MRPHLLPLPILALASLLALAAVAMSVALAVNQPSLGLTLSVLVDESVVIIKSAEDAGPAGAIERGAQVVSLTANGETMALQPIDITPEPDVIATYENLNEFRARQGALREILSQPSVTLDLLGADGVAQSYVIDPAPKRPMGDLALAFWVQIFVGFTGMVVGAWVWVLRRASPESSLLFIAGIGLLASAFAAAIYSTRELALGIEFFRYLSFINQMGAMLFGVATLGLFAIYPVKILPKWVVTLATVLFLLMPVGNYFQVVGDPIVGSQIPILLNMILICVLIAWQYHATRGDPVSRAILVWLGLSFLTGIGVFGVLISAPPLFGAETLLEQSYAFMGFLFIYVGIALGVARYRLFDLQDWSPRILSYLAAIVMILLADMALVFGLSVAPLSALALALLASLTLYLPLRDVVSARLLGRNKPNTEAVFDDLVGITLASASANQTEMWKALLQKLFMPLGLTEIALDATEPTPNLQIEREGRSLCVPAVDHLPPLRLEWKARGCRLFSEKDIENVETLIRMLRHSLQSRDAFEDGVLKERTRIARDMHDNIGIQLLGALHADKIPRKNELVREALSDLRDIVANASDPQKPLDETIVELRLEVSELLATCEIALEWKVDVTTHTPLSPNISQTLRALIREAATNVVRHANAKNMRVSITQDSVALRIRVQDDGDGFDIAHVHSGNGISNLTDRVNALNGTLNYSRVSPTDGGTLISCVIPLQDNLDVSEVSL